MNASSIGLIRVTNPQTRRMSRTTHDITWDRYCHDVWQQSFLHPQTLDWTADNFMSNGGPNRPIIEPLFWSRRPYNSDRQQRLRMKKLQVDGHVHLQHYVFQAANHHQQATEHLLPSLEMLALRLHASVQTHQLRSCLRSAWAFSSCAESCNESG